MVHSAAARPDPAADAALLLRRIGFAVLCVAMPFAAIGARRSAVILMPIGVILLILAALLDSSEQAFGVRLSRLLQEPVSWALVGFGMWVCLSLAWTPALRPGVDRVANIAGLLAVLIGGLASIPARLRAPILYMLPIGAFLSVVAASVIVLDMRMGRYFFMSVGDGATVQRGLATLVLMSVPAAGWLLTRGRVVDAALLGLGLLAVAAAANDLAMAGGVVVATMVLALMRFRPGLGRWILWVAFAAMALIALLPLLFKTWQGQSFAGISLMPLFSGSFLRRLGRLVTGYGIEAAPRVAGQFQPGGPSYFAGIWFDLGLVAVALIATGMAMAFEVGRRVSADLGAVTLALIAVVVWQGISLSGSYQAWWMSSVIAAIVGIAAIARGQARSRRPGVGLFTRP